MNRLADAVSRLSDRSKLRWLALLCLAWIVPGLIGHQPWKPDEAHSFGIVYHILKSGDWLVPTLAGEPFMEKPPLYFYTAALFAKLFSPLLPAHDGARLATGLFMALTLLFAGLSGRELWGEGRGRITVVVMLGCLGLLVRAHELIADMALLAGFAAALYGFAIGLRRWAWGGAWIGIGAGIGFMGKGAVAPLVVVSLALALSVARPWHDRRYLWCLFAAAAAAAPWFVIWPALLHAHSPALFAAWFAASAMPKFGVQSDYGYYLVNLSWYAWPALPLALWVLWREKWRQAPIQLALGAFLAMLAVLALTTDARDIHMLPMLLPLSLLATPGADSLRRGAANALNWFGIMTFGFFAGLLWFFWFALMTGHPARKAEHLLELQPGYTPLFVPSAFVVALAYTGAWLAVLFLTRRVARGRRALINWGAGVTLLWGIVATIGLPWVDAGRSYRSMVISLQQALPTGYRCIAGESLGESQRALLDYYGGIITRRSAAAGKQDCDLLLVQGRANAPHEPGAGWIRLWDGARPGDKAERYWLFRRIP